MLHHQIWPRHLSLAVLGGGGHGHPQRRVHRLPRLCNQQDAVGGLQQEQQQNRGAGVQRRDVNKGNVCRAAFPCNRLALQPGQARCENAGKQQHAESGGQTGNSPLQAHVTAGAKHAARPLSNNIPAMNSSPMLQLSGTAAGAAQPGAYLHRLHLVMLAGAPAHRLLQHAVRALHVACKLQLVQSARMPRLCHQQLVAVGAPCQSGDAALQSAAAALADGGKRVDASATLAEQLGKGR